MVLTKSLQYCTMHSVTTSVVCFAFLLHRRPIIPSPYRTYTRYYSFILCVYLHFFFFCSISNLKESIGSFNLAFDVPYRLIQLHMDDQLRSRELLFLHRHHEKMMVRIGVSQHDWQNQLTMYLKIAHLAIMDMI